VKKLKTGQGRYVRLNMDKEDPLKVDPSQLKIVSTRKLWQQRHNFLKKHVDKKKIRKGIYD